MSDKEIDVPLSHTLAYSLVTILWWVGIWGLSESILTLLKSSLSLRFGIYITMIIIALVLMSIHPKIIEHL